jgi:hypothetical protein
LLLFKLILFIIISVRLPAGGRQAFIIAHHGKASQTCHVAKQSPGFHKIICGRWSATLVSLASPFS